MIVVAHDVPMVMGLVDRLYVLASGQLIAEGPPDLLSRDEAVIAAYLGSEALAHAGDGDRSTVGAP
jgi:ABC-type branched-subunit amino acid transport system ATPase component